LAEELSKFFVSDQILNIQYSQLSTMALDGLNNVLMTNVFDYDMMAENVSAAEYQMLIKN